MEEQYEVKKDIEYYVKSSDDECCSQENSISKNTLDLFLPLHSDSSTPIVVFVHGGGWMRGDKQAYRHYFSCYDTNLLVALLFSYYDGYANVGKSFARAGIACAVISYRLSRLEFPWLLLELTMSLLMSLTVLLTPLVFVAFVAGIVSNVLHRTEDNFNFTAQSGSILSYCTLLLLFSLFILWFIVCQNGDGYFIPPQAKFYPLILSLVVSTACLLVLDIELVSFASCLTICMVLFLLHSFAMFQRSCRPIVRHPSHINDVARSVAWVVGYGNATKRYNQEQVFLCGHSAGGHLVSLLALDSNYLENVGVPLSNIKGVISISGVYNLHKLASGFLGPLYLHPAFGTNPKTWTQASPYHSLQQLPGNTKEQGPTDTSLNGGSLVHQTRVPFLVINAAMDFLLHDDAVTFVALLKEKGFQCEHFVSKGSNHLSIVLTFGQSSFKMLQSSNCEQTAEMLCLEFVKRNILLS